MFYIEELKKAASATAAMLSEDEVRVGSLEYAAEIRARYENVGDTLPSFQVGYLRGSIMKANYALGHISRLAEHAQEESAWPERCAALCEALGIDSDNIDALELMTKGTRYRSECGDLTERIREAAGGIITDTRERELEQAIAALLAAGFTEGDEDVFTRVGSEGQTRVGIGDTVNIGSKHRRGEYWYEFVLEVNGIETLRGKSGEFQRLLEAVGIKQEVGN